MRECNREKAMHGGVIVKIGKSSGDCHNWETLDLGERSNVS